MTPLITARRLLRDLGDWRGSGAAYQALADRIRILLLDGRLSTGSRLPAERELSQMLDVSRTTVAGAYALLRELGFAVSVRGSGTTLALPDGRRGSYQPEEGLAVDFTKATPPAYPGLEAAYREAMNRLPGYFGHPGFDLVGLPELREAIAAHFERRGLPTSPEQILVTVGAQHALNLLTGALYTPGDRILVEHPTYPHALDTFTAAGARLLAAPVGPDGWDISEAETLLRRSSPSLAYLMPDFQNPTGSSMPEADRERLSRAAAREGTTLIIDETTAGLDIERGPRQPMAAFGSGAVTIGSMGKIAWGGLRIGWIRGPRDLLARVLRRRPSVDLGTPLLEQLTAAALLRQEDALLAFRSRQLRQGRDHLAALLRKEFPQWELPRVQGGLSFWLPAGETSTSSLVLAARNEGLGIVAGPRFGIDGAFERYLRLPFCYPQEDLTDAVAMLRRAMLRVGEAPARVPLQAVI